MKKETAPKHFSRPLPAAADFRQYSSKKRGSFSSRHKEEMKTCIRTETRRGKYEKKVSQHSAAGSVTSFPFFLILRRMSVHLDLKHGLKAERPLISTTGLCKKYYCMCSDYPALRTTKKWQEEDFLVVSFSARAKEGRFCQDLSLTNGGKKGINRTKTVHLNFSGPEVCSCSSCRYENDRNDRKHLRNSFWDTACPVLKTGCEETCLRIQGIFKRQGQDFLQKVWKQRSPFSYTLRHVFSFRLIARSL